MSLKNETEKNKAEKPLKKIHGFEIELNNEKLTRIDRLVKNYERRVARGWMNIRSARNYPNVAFGESWIFIS